MVKASNISITDELRRQKKLHEGCAKGIEFFGPFPHLVNYYNCRTEKAATINDLKNAINASTAADPLWIIVAGEPDIIGYALQAATSAQRQFVHVVSHHPANHNSGDFFTWAHILAFGVSEHQISDQNIGLHVPIKSGLWNWAENHPRPEIVWILDQLKYAEADGVVRFQDEKYDCSDAGMIYWWLTGANHGGEKNATPNEIKNILLLHSSAPLANAISKRAEQRKTKVSIKGPNFLINDKPTYQGVSWKNPQGKKISMEGLLMNARVVQGIFDDLNPKTSDKWGYKDTGKWDPERNTNEFIQAMESWRQHGLLSFTINLQGGSPEGYSKGQPWINSAFDTKGNLRESYMNRLARILKRADELGMVAIVGYFYFGQDQRLQDEAAVKNAVTQATSWLLNGNWDNVIVEINNECNVSYDHEILKPQRVHELIEQVKAIHAHERRLLVSTSYGGGTLPSKKVITVSDYVLLHGNGVSDPKKMLKLIKDTRELIGNDLKPIINNEDDRPWRDKHQGFGEQGNNMVVSIENGVSWGYFDFRQQGEPQAEGFQNPPTDWGINSKRKKQFFGLLKKVTGH